MSVIMHASTLQYAGSSFGSSRELHAGLIGIHRMYAYMSDHSGACSQSLNEVDVQTAKWSNCHVPSLGFRAWGTPSCMNTRGNTRNKL